MNNMTASWMERLRKRRRQRRYLRRFARSDGSMGAFDTEARETIARVGHCTMVTPNMLFALVEAVRYVHRCAIPGAVVECGVWRGGAIMAAAMTFKRLGVEDRTFYLYDTFTGMTKPGDADFSVDGEIDPRDQFHRTQTGPDSSDWCRAGLEEVRRNLADTGYDPDRFVTVEGKVEDTIPGTIPRDIAILRLDTDWYQSTRHEMAHLFPRLAPKGVLIIDDYHTWSGSQRAVDEYLAAANIPMLLTRVDGGAVGVKP